MAAKKVTTPIPIVFTSLPHPVEIGLIKSLARPGGNITGVTVNAGTTVTKRLELLSDRPPPFSEKGTSSRIKRAKPLWASVTAAEVEDLLASWLVFLRDKSLSKPELDMRLEEALEQLEGQERGKAVHVEVRDSGVGLAPGLQARMFEVFYTTKESGTRHGALDRQDVSPGLRHASRTSCGRW